MKRIVLASFLLISTVGFGQCPTSALTLTTQNQIDNFAVNYPGCTSLDVPLTIDGPDITNLNGLIQLQHVNDLNISNTSIVDFTGLDQLITNNWHFSINNNNSLINFTGLGQLETVGYLLVGNNENLQSFEGIGGITEFQSGEKFLFIYNNPSLTTLEHLTGLIASVGDLQILDNNALTNLNGLENIGFLYGLTIRNNLNLNNIDALGYVPVSNTTGVRIENNANLSNCSIANICYLLDTGQNVFNVENNGTGCNTEVEIFDNCTTGLNIITGRVSYDLLANSCSTGDVDFSSVLVDVTDGTFSRQTSTNENGEYTLFVGEGTFTTSLNLNSIPAYLSVVVNDVLTIFSDTGNTEQIDFCLTPNSEANDLKVTIVPRQILRPGFESYFKLVIENIGTSSANGTVSVQFDDGRLTFVEANPIETSSTTSSISWDFINLLPFSSQEFNYTLDSFQPPINQIGDITSFQAEIIPITGDETPLDNVYDLQMVYLNAEDPNDKFVNQGSEIEISDVGEFLDYNIRFQNLGNANAVNVRVVDVLSENLNWSTFRPISSSHSYSVEILNGNQLSFNFDNINLPPEVTDPEGSKGFIAFQIRTDETLQIGDEIENTANIYFDFNAPIVTNTVTTTVVDELFISEFDLNKFISIYPNPVSEKLHITISEGVLFENATVYSFLGEQLIIASEKYIDVSFLSAGIYFIEVETDMGTITKRIIKE